MSDARARELIESVTSSDLTRARALLAVDPELARYDLACACATGELEFVASAARPQAVNEPIGPNGWTPILYACFSRLLRSDPERAAGIRAVVHLLLELGADPNSYYIDEGWLEVALFGAAGVAGDPKLTKMLLDAGADPNDQRDGLEGNEVLYHACEQRDPTCARIVIEAGAEQDVINHALGRALNFPNHEMVEMFCAHGAEASAGHLHQAVWRRRPLRTLAALLQAGAPVDAPDDHGLTPLQIALLWGDFEAVAVLRQHGATPAGIPDMPTELADEMVILAIQGGHLDRMLELLDGGARVDGDPSGDEVPLGQACWRGRAVMARELIERGATLEFRDGGSALGAATHGSRNCQHPEGGPTMGTVDEIPQQPYDEIIAYLAARTATA